MEPINSARKLGRSVQVGNSDQPIIVRAGIRPFYTATLKDAATVSSTGVRWPRVFRILSVCRPVFCAVPVHRRRLCRRHAHHPSLTVSPLYEDARQGTLVACACPCIMHRMRAPSWLHTGSGSPHPLLRPVRHLLQFCG